VDWDQFIPKSGKRAFLNRFKRMAGLQLKLVDQGTPKGSQVSPAIESLPEVMSNGTHISALAAGHPEIDLGQFETEGFELIYPDEPWFPFHGLSLSSQLV
jgi:hypothetical protein